MHRFPLLIGMVALALALLARVGAAQDAKKEGEKVIKGSIPAGWKALKLSKDQAEKIQMIDADYQTKIAAQNKIIAQLQQQSRIEMAQQLNGDQKALLARLQSTGDSRTLTILQQIAMEEYATVRRELSGIESQIRRTKTLLKLQRADLDNAMAEKLPASLIEEIATGDAQVQKEQSEIDRLQAKIKEYRGVANPGSPGLRVLEQNLKEARARLQKTRSGIQPDAGALQAIRKSLHREQFRKIELVEEKLKDLKEQHAVVLEEATYLSKEVDRLGIAAFELERRRAEKVENELRRSNDKDKH